MAYEFKAVRRVEFSETDMAGIVHFSNFFRYMETAERGFFESLGHPLSKNHSKTPVGWPRVHAECDYRQPLRFEDELEIHLLVARKKPRVLTYLFKFTKLNGSKPVEIARGSLAVVCVTKKHDGTLAATRIPANLAAKIQAAPSASLK
jgi:acyl-CoA thioester hydrolase